MDKNYYQKPALTFADQLAKLEQRGMVIEHRDLALEQLACISYYRLSAYWYPFRQWDKQGNTTNQFNPGTTFSQVIELYEFDRHLRLLVLDAIERIEIAIRTQFTYHLAHKYGAFAHIDPSHFHPEFKHAEWLAKLQKEVERSKDAFIQHYQQKYHGFPTVPIWMLTEVMSLGSLSVGYNGLQNNKKLGVEDKKAVADRFKIHHKRLVGWLHTLTYIRNVCAHHSRLWNRELAIRDDKSKEEFWLPPMTPRNDRVYYILLILRCLMRPLGNGDAWATDVTNLLEPISG